MDINLNISSHISTNYQDLYERTIYNTMSEHRPNTIVKILETALASKGTTLTKAIHKSDLTESPEKLKMYLSILEDNRLIAYHKSDGVYRTTYRGMRFLRTYKNTIDVLSNLKKE